MERNSELRELVERRLRGGIVSPQSEADDWPSWPRRVETDHHHLQRVESELRRLGAENEALRARQLTSDRMLQTAQHTNDRCSLSFYYDTHFTPVGSSVNDVTQFNGKINLTRFPFRHSAADPHLIMTSRTSTARGQPVVYCSVYRNELRCI